MLNPKMNENKDDDYESRYRAAATAAASSY